MDVAQSYPPPFPQYSSPQPPRPVRPARWLLALTVVLVLALRLSRLCPTVLSGSSCAALH